jgi:hypothetical protein
VGRILLIGECMVEFSPKADGDYKRGFAGDTFNTAWYLRQHSCLSLALPYFVDMAMCNVRSGLKCLLGAYHLLCNSVWRSRIIIFGWQRTSDRYAYMEGKLMSCSV